MRSNCADPARPGSKTRVPAPVPAGNGHQAERREREAAGAGARRKLGAAEQQVTVALRPVVNEPLDVRETVRDERSQPALDCGGAERASVMRR